MSEYLGAAELVCRPTQPTAWRRTQQQRLQRGAVPKVIAALAEQLEAQAVPDEDAPVRAGHRYLKNRLHCLDYPGALALGLPIGSGMIERATARCSKPGSKKPVPLDCLNTPTRSPTCACCAPTTSSSHSGINLAHF